MSFDSTTARPTAPDEVTAIELRLPPSITIAGGARHAIAETARRIGISRAVIVTDPYLASNGPVGELADELRGGGVHTDIFSGVQSDPTSRNVLDALALFRECDADGFIAIGGGSPIDVAKAASIMATNPGAIEDYAGYHKIPRAGAPVLAVPTTAGTGSEVTRVTVITDTEGRRKMMILDDHLLCAAALVDYELTLTCPPALTAHVAIDSLTHAIEAYVSSKANGITDQWALAASRLISRNIRTAYRNPTDASAREALARGATLAGMAFSNSSVALVHGMSRPIGAFFHVPHGLSNAVLLPTVTRYSVGSAPARYARIYREIADEYDIDDHEACKRLVDELQQLNADLDVPRLSQLDIEREAFDAVTREMAEAAIASGSPAFNPRVPDVDEIVALYEEAY